MTQRHLFRLLWNFEGWFLTIFRKVCWNNFLWKLIFGDLWFFSTEHWSDFGNIFLTKDFLFSNGHKKANFYPIKKSFQQTLDNTYNTTPQNIRIIRILAKNDKKCQKSAKNDKNVKFFFIRNSSIFCII
jgi:hypothetical protein